MNAKESGENLKERSEVEENRMKLNENYEDEAPETGNVDQAEEEKHAHLNSKKNEENSEGMEHFNYQDDPQPEEETKEDSQNQVSAYAFSLLF